MLIRALLALSLLSPPTLSNLQSVAYFLDTEPLDRWVRLGEVVEFSCGTTVAVETGWSWRLHDGTSDTSGTLLPATSATLQLGPVTLQHNDKMVSCIAAIYGTQVRSRLAIVRVSYLEGVFQKEPVDTQVPRRTGQVRLDCVAPAGNPPPYLVWTRNGAPVDEANTYIDPLGGLNILNVDNTDAGSYQCIAKSFKDHEDVTSREAELSISGSVTYTTEPVTYDVSFAKAKYRVSVTEGDSVRVVCGFVGSPTPTFTLLSAAGAPLSGSQHGTWADLTHIADVEEVKCQGSNTEGQQVFNIPIDITGSLRVAGGGEVEVIEGKPSTLTCIVSKANGDVTYSWYRNGALLAGETGAKFSLPSPTRSDSAMYQCFAATEHAKEQATFAVTVNAVTSQPVKVTVAGEEYGLLGESLQLSCVGEGNPIPTVTWHRKVGNSVNAISLTHVSYVETFTEVLAVLNLDTLSDTDDGVDYICKGDNTDLYDTSTHYRAESTIKLKVVAAIEPSISLPSTSHIKSGTPLTLICAVDGSPPPAIQWYKNGVVIEGATKEEYVTKGEAGIFMCKATNMLGTVEQQVIVESLPEFSGGEIFLILLIVVTVLLVLVVVLLIVVRRHELERRLKEARAKDELLLENEKRVRAATPSSRTVTPSLLPAPLLEEGLVEEGGLGEEVECQTPRSILSPRPPSGGGGSVRL